MRVRAQQPKEKPHELLFPSCFYIAPPEAGRGRSCPRGVRTSYVTGQGPKEPHSSEEAQHPPCLASGTAGKDALQHVEKADSPPSGHAVLVGGGCRQWRLSSPVGQEPDEHYLPSSQGLPLPLFYRRGNLCKCTQLRRGGTALGSRGSRLTSCSSQDAKRSLWVAEGPGANEHARASGVEEEAIRTRKMAAGGLCFRSLARPGEDRNHQRPAVPLSN